MFHLSIPLSTIEVVMLLVVATITVLVIRFFIISQRNLKQALQKTNQNYFQKPSFEAPPRKKAVDILQERAKEGPAKPVYTAEPVVEEKLSRKKQPGAAKEESVEHLKETIQQQQRLLNGFLKQVEEIENEGKEELQLENKHLQKEIRMLELQLEEKDAEMAELKQQAAVSDRMNARIEEVYQELEELQSKMMQLEKQATRANSLALELEDTRESFEQVHKELKRKNEKLSEAFEENEVLKAQMREIEDKLAESNLQRQQLQRKTQFLQDLNTDLQGISDTNKKLSSELRRIGELESMLNMIAEERDHLLQKQAGK
jgi:chromosome segregation ATPase